MKEPVLDYLLNGIIGRLGIVPFKRNIMHTFKNNNEGKDEETLSIKYFCCLSIEITKIKRINFNSLCIPSDLSAIIGIGPGDKIEVSL